MMNYGRVYPQYPKHKEKNPLGWIPAYALNDGDEEGMSFLNLDAHEPLIPAFSPREKGFF